MFRKFSCRLFIFSFVCSLGSVSLFAERAGGVCEHVALQIASHHSLSTRPDVERLKKEVQRTHRAMRKVQDALTAFNQPQTETLIDSVRRNFRSQKAASKRNRKNRVRLNELRRDLQEARNDWERAKANLRLTALELLSAESEEFRGVVEFGLQAKALIRKFKAKNGEKKLSREGEWLKLIGEVQSWKGNGWRELEQLRNIYRSLGDPITELLKLQNRAGDPILTLIENDVNALEHTILQVAAERIAKARARRIQAEARWASSDPNSPIGLGKMSPVHGLVETLEVISNNLGFLEENPNALAQILSEGGLREFLPISSVIDILETLVSETERMIQLEIDQSFINRRI